MNNTTGNPAVTYTNNVTVTAQGLHGDSGAGASSTSASTNVKVETMVLEKSGVGYNVPDKKIEWKLAINQNQMRMTNPVITDILSPGTELVTGSGIIADVFGGNTDIIQSFTYDAPSRLLTIYLKDQAPKAGIKNLTYKTHVTDMTLLCQNSQGIVTNTAVLKCDEMGSLSASSSAEKKIGVSVLEKKGVKGQLDGNDVLKWTLTFNKNGIPIQEPELTDTLPSGLELRESSLKVYRVTSLKSNGEVESREALDPENGDYSYTNQSNVLTVSIPGTIYEPYQIEFATYFEATGDYSNSASLKGAGFAQITADSGNVHADAAGSGGGTASKGSITIIKTDENNNPLPGAVFYVNGNTGVTDDNGRLVFDNLRMDEYIVTEQNAPEGYLIVQKDYKIKLTSGDKDKAQKVENRLIRGSVEIQKTDSATGAPLPGAELGLYIQLPDGTFEQYAPSDGSGPSNPQITDSAGKVLFDHIPYGNYYYHELAAPNGFVADNSYYPVDIRQDGRTVSLKFGNGHAAGGLEILKVGAGSGEPLEGAEFTVFRSRDRQAVAAGVTGTDGKVLFSSLLTGTDYYYKETKAPYGYTGDLDTEYPFCLMTHGETMTVKIENQRAGFDWTGGGSSGGGGGSSSSTGVSPGGQPSQPPVNPEADPELAPDRPGIPEHPDIPDIPIQVEPEAEGGNRVTVPGAPDTDIIILNSQGNVVHKGRTDSSGISHFELPAGSYMLYTIDEEGVPMAECPFTIEDAGVPLGLMALPKTGEDRRRGMISTVIWINSMLGLALMMRNKLIRRYKKH